MGLEALTEAGRAVIAIGDCYRYAVKWKPPSGGNEDDQTVVHGTVVEPLKKNSKRFDHAWVEWHGKVFDFQTKDTKPEGIPLDQFYKLWKAKPGKRYTPEEALILAVRNMHFGPW